MVEDNFEITEETEIYSLDINKDSTYIIYGGKDDKCRILDFNTLEEKYIIDIFKDSIQHVNFLDNDHFIVVTLDGAFMEYKIINENLQVIREEKIKNDVSTVCNLDKKIAIGTNVGEIYYYNNDFEMVFSNHSSEILELKIHENFLFSLSVDALIVYNLDSFSLHRRIGIRNIENFHITNFQNIFLLSFNDHIKILKRNEILQRIDMKGKPLCFLNSDDLVFVGCDTKYICLLNFKANVNTFYIDCVDGEEDIEGITHIKIINSFFIVFSTLCGKIGFGDFRDKNTFLYQKCCEGVILSFEIRDNIIFWYGESGFGVLELQN
ncbi:hypothetical protein SLOPH_1213 [Spraguea lophii 42_110]|uniref:Uncharacterized protein n=1 Tax=Spraguea lophii (strain 42_110) TaxID=1358809 RepID=S7W9E7_SPRLO|nr:hypothetical protein SLOPH_1213 [Spraguea lophii 42_110]